jgi:hypothetical protein
VCWYCLQERSDTERTEPEMENSGREYRETEREREREKKGATTT